MIEFITCYDEATRENYQVYSQIKSYPTNLKLIGHDAIRKKVISYSGQSDWFIMSHGDDKVIVGNDGLSALDGTNVSLIGARHIFAYCCHSANILGKLAASKGITYVGFCDAIPPPSQNPSVINNFIQLLEFFISEFVKIECIITANNFITNIVGFIDETERDFDKLDTISEAEYMILHRLKSKIMVFTPGVSEPIVSTFYNERPIF